MGDESWGVENAEGWAEGRLILDHKSLKCPSKEASHEQGCDYARALLAVGSGEGDAGM